MRARAWTQVTAPTGRVLSVEEAKEHLRVSVEDEDALLDAYLAAAEGWAESYMGRALLTQTWQAHFAGWPSDGVLELPVPPLQSVTWVKYTTDAGVLTTVSASVYRVVSSMEPARLVLAPNQEWPSETLDAGLPVVVQFVCGYASGTAVPEAIRQGIRWTVGHMFENREAVMQANTPPLVVPMTAEWALDPLRVRYIW